MPKVPALSIKSLSVEGALLPRPGQDIFEGDAL